MDNREIILDRYFKGLLSKEEQLNLEELIRTDPDFKEEFEFRKLTQKAVILEKREELKGFLKELDNEIVPDGRTRQLVARPSLLKVAAGLAAILVVAALIFQLGNSNEETVNSDSFLSYYSPYPNVVSPITRGDEINPEDIEKSAFIAYESKNYGLADSLFSQVLPFQQDYVSFYKGISKFELGQYDSAAKYFDNYLYSEGTQLRDQAKWYMALSYLVKGDTIKGKEELIRLRKSSGYKMDEVERILLDLE